MKKRIIGIISVVVSCIVYGITKHFFDKDREKKREEENKMIHDSVEKIFNESRKRNEEEIKKMKEENEKRMKENEERMKEIEEKRREQTKTLDELKERIKAREIQIDNAKNLNEKIEAIDENRKDIMKTFYSVFGKNHKTSGQKLADVLEAKLKEIKEDN